MTSTVGREGTSRSVATPMLGAEIGGSSKGRTPGFGPGNRGSNPCPPAPRPRANPPPPLRATPPPCSEPIRRSCSEQTLHPCSEPIRRPCSEQPLHPCSEPIRVLAQSNVG